jgi:hypothetical protein
MSRSKLDILSDIFQILSNVALVAFFIVVALTPPVPIPVIKQYGEDLTYIVPRSCDISVISGTTTVTLLQHRAFTLSYYIVASVDSPFPDISTYLQYLNNSRPEPCRLVTATQTNAANTYTKYSKTIVSTKLATLTEEDQNGCSVIKSPTYEVYTVAKIDGAGISSQLTSVVVPTNDFLMQLTVKGNFTGLQQTSGQDLVDKLFLPMMKLPRFSCTESKTAIQDTASLQNLVVGFFAAALTLVGVVLHLMATSQAAGKRKDELVSVA